MKWYAYKIHYTMIYLDIMHYFVQHNLISLTDFLFKKSGYFILFYDSSWPPGRIFGLLGLQ